MRGTTRSVGSKQMVAISLKLWAISLAISYISSMVVTPKHLNVTACFVLWNEPVRVATIWESNHLAIRDCWLWHSKNINIIIHFVLTTIKHYQPWSKTCGWLRHEPMSNTILVVATYCSEFPVLPVHEPCSFEPLSTIKNHNEELLAAYVARCCCLLNQSLSTAMLLVVSF